jgi:sirohydrochlorin cobaltochelatase
MPVPRNHPGLLLVGHGTRSETGTRQFLELAGQLATMLPTTPVEPAFLELQQPDIASGLQRLRERGAQRIVVCPLLLFAAGHAKDDIPAAVRLASGKEESPLQAEHLGLHPALLALSRQRFDEALAGKLPNAPGQTCLLLVGRGSHDSAATAEMCELARQRSLQSPDLDVTVAFLAMAQPALGELLPQVAAKGYRRVIVQPHLLFSGELADSVRQQVADIARQHGEQEWMVTPLLADPLAPGPRSTGYSAAEAQEPVCGGNKLLCQALSERYAAAIRVVATPGDD